MRSASSIFGSARATAARLVAAGSVLAMVAGAPAATASTGSVGEGSATGTSLRAMPAPRGLRVIASVDAGETERTSARIAALERAGFRVEVAVAPGTFFVRPHAGAALPAGFADVTAGLDAAGAASAGAEELASGTASLVLEPSASALDDPFQGRGDALPPFARSGGVRAPRPATTGSIAALQGVPYGAGWESTSELMIGSVAVPILFPESDGTVDPDRFDWTPALRDSVVRSAVRGFLRWTSLAAARGIPLTFVIEVHPTLPTRFEPIDRAVSEEYLWIEDTLEPIVGYQADAGLMAYDLANAARARLGTQWAALVFAVQNDTDTDGTFPDGLIAHATLGGPWFVVPVNNLNTRSATLDFYMEHEMTHMFWALDEFPAANAWWSCTYLTGYFNQPNWNSAVPLVRYCGVDDRCLMKGNYPDSLCKLTERQVGWVDENANATLDLFETRPAVRPDPISDSVTPGGTLVVRGAAADVALPNRNSFLFGEGDSITLATIDSVWCRLNAGPWLDVPPEDGRYDEGNERFVITMPAPPVGDHRLQFLAKNSNGLTGLVPDSLTFSVSGGSATGPQQGGAPRPSIGAAPSPSSGPVRLSLRARPGTPVTARVVDVAGREVRAWRMEVPASGALEWEWDGRSERGSGRAGGVYFLNVDAGAERLTRRIVLFR